MNSENQKFINPFNPKLIMQILQPFKKKMIE